MVLQKQAMDRRFEPSEVDGEPISAKVHEPRLTHRFGTEPGKSWRPPGAVLPPPALPQDSWIFPGQQEDVGLLLPRRYRVRVRVGEDDEGECE